MQVCSHVRTVFHNPVSSSSAPPPKSSSWALQCAKIPQEIILASCRLWITHVEHPPLRGFTSCIKLQHVDAHIGNIGRQCNVAVFVCSPLSVDNPVVSQVLIVFGSRLPSRS